MAIIIPENIVFKETKVEGNIKCPICGRTLIINGFLGQEVTGPDTSALAYAYCIDCDKYFKSTPINVDKEEL